MNLKDVRKRKGLTQVQAANLLSIPLRTFKRYETDASVSNFKIESAIQKLLSYNKKHSSETGEKSSLLIVGAGFVGLTCAEVYSKEFNIALVDNNKEKVKQLRKKYIVFDDVDKARNYDYVLLCLPTDYDDKTKTFNTEAIETTISKIIKKNPNSMIIVKSTVAVGYTDLLTKKYGKSIYFMPEFLREKTALEDALRPIRIVIGCSKINEKLRVFSKKIENCSLNPIKTTFVLNKEAEAIKLLSNSYLAMRVAFFNEVDSFAIDNNLNTKDIIKSLGADERIGDIYNDPSFGYSGYCLPKDVKVLTEQTNSSLLKAINDSNEKRKDKIVKEILKLVASKKKPTIGFYNLDITTKARKSASLEIMEKLSKYSVKILVFDKIYEKSMHNLNEFIHACDLIVSDKNYKSLEVCKDKVYCRSIN